MLSGVNKGNPMPVQHPEYNLVSSLSAIQKLQSSVSAMLSECGLARYAHQFAGSGPTTKALVTVPDLFTYFEPLFAGEERIRTFEQRLKRISRTLNLFRALYFYEPKQEKIYLRKMKDCAFSYEDVSDILTALKEKNVIRLSHDNPLLFTVENRAVYKQFLKETILSKGLDDFSHILQQPIHTNPQAYSVLAEFEAEFRTV